MRLLVILLFLFPNVNISAQADFTAWDAFLRKYVTASGEVDYKNIKSNIKDLNAITKSFSATQVKSTWSKNDQLAFWINAYNAFTIQLITDNYPLKSIQGLDGGMPWDVKRITIGGKKYSLNNIENDIIRPQFKDARIHFAVNCAAKSCPPLLNSAFMGKTLDSQLDAVTKKFINNAKYQTVTSSKMTISKIFEWYAVDFGKVPTFINKYSNTKTLSSAKVSFAEYDWSLNDKK
jgi:hypothetical protein